MPRKKFIPPIPLKIIIDKCFSGHRLYFAKLDDDVVLYCPICKHWCDTDNTKDSIVQLKEDEFDFLFHPERYNEYDLPIIE